jgi:hypothetical protein
MPNVPEIVDAEKWITHFPGWTNPEPETGSVFFNAPLAIDGVVISGFFLEGLALKPWPDRNVVMELVIRQATSRKRLCLARICWRSLKMGHSNKRRPWPHGVTEARTGPTHIHRFGFNWQPEKDGMRSGNLPYAETVKEALETYDDLLEFTGESFKIKNIELVHPPPWEYDLFHGTGDRR